MGKIRGHFQGIAAYGTVLHIGLVGHGGIKEKGDFLPTEGTLKIVFQHRGWILAFPKGTIPGSKPKKGGHSQYPPHQLTKVKLTMDCRGSHPRTWYPPYGSF